MITIGLVDDELLFSEGLTMILGGQADCRVVWSVANADDGVQRQAEEPADVVLMDLQMPGRDGVSATKEMVGMSATARVVMLTTFDSDNDVLDAIEAGAVGFLLKSSPPDYLVAAIRSVFDGDAVISPGPTKRLLAAFREGRRPRPFVGSSPEDLQVLEALTRRELDVLRLVAQGFSNQEICDRMWLTMSTIKTHVGNLITKTWSTNRVQLALFAFRTGVAHVPGRIEPGSAAEASLAHVSDHSAG